MPADILRFDSMAELVQLRNACSVVYFCKSVGARCVQPTDDLHILPQYLRRNRIVRDKSAALGSPGSRIKLSQKDMLHRRIRRAAIACPPLHGVQKYPPKGNCMSTNKAHDHTSFSAPPGTATGQTRSNGICHLVQAPHIDSHPPS